MSSPTIGEAGGPRWSSPDAETFVPDGSSADAALRRTTHLGIGAHADDLEIMAYHGILAGFDANGQSFTGVTLTDGKSSARTSAYASYSDEQMAEARRREQRAAAALGRYGAMVQLSYASAAVKGESTAVDRDLDALLATMSPAVVYTHNLADKHDTHVAVALRVVAALRRRPAAAPPVQLLGCEVWRDLDWLCDEDKISMAVDGRDDLAEDLLRVFDSQISGGKRYDLATLGRRAAHATFFESRATDGRHALLFGMDLSPLLRNPDLDPATFVEAHIARFAHDVRSRITRLQRGT